MDSTVTISENQMSSNSWLGNSKTSALLTSINLLFWVRYMDLLLREKIFSTVNFLQTHLRLSLS